MASLAVPLLFVVAFPLAFVSAFHAPTPNDAAITVVGPNSVVGDLVTSLDETDEFRVVQSEVTSHAKQDVKTRDSIGALLVEMHEDPSQGPASVTAYVGSGNGPSTAAIVRSTGEKVASQLGVPLSVQDLAPLAPEDPMGSNLFYLFIYSTVGAFMLVIVLAETAPKTKPSRMFAVVGIGSVLIPVLVFGLSSVFVGDYGASFGAIAALLAVDALYVFTIGSIAILMHEFLGGSLLIGVLLLTIFLNVPGSGGPVPYALLPDFWQWVHSVSFGAGAMESFRSLVYFGGHGVTRWILQLVSWTVAVPAAVALVAIAKSNARMRAELSALDRSTRRRGSIGPDAPIPTTPVPTQTATEGDLR
ncbi:hypothetical protein ASF40_20500 [Microbacterium sp. Leaf288]|uniref:ABC transporter permease n=1 Tax=Microbacterium sp. Leaf288 TaxID=1736323 RepID=UPI0006F3F5C4|nr:ABC transporter permease [Microbacterium sp. Leaf288]KQP73224.1 hypothetical protein ASF40_20500 [Microbacterium sp. Leaf288]